MKDIIRAVQKQILSLFKTSVPSRVDAEIDRKLDGLPHIDGVEESSFRFRGVNLKGAVVEHFFSTYPNQKRSKILAENIKNLEESSKLFDLDCLFFSDSTIMAPMILNQFKGSHLYLFNAELKMEDVMKFFRKWKSGEAYQNLKYLYIGLKSGEFEPEATIQLDAKPWDPTKRPRVFNRSPKILEWLTSKSMIESLECEDLSDIEREDGRLASVFIDLDFLRVCVWNDPKFDKEKDD